jgi:hypothetical protein
MLASGGLETLQPSLVTASALVFDCLSEPQAQRIPLNPGIYIFGNLILALFYLLFLFELLHTYCFSIHTQIPRYQTHNKRSS